MSTLTNNPVAKAVKLALFAGAAASLAVPSVYAAENAKADDEGEKVIVTGSRIKRVDMENAQPVTVITREELDLSGDTSVADALRNQSANTFGSWKGQSGYGAGATGSAEIDLRGLGATLVLIDGRRMPGAGYDAGQTQDLNNIPLSIVERIEILRSGASAIYGSDAVAGVVNIITRKEVDGGSLRILKEERGVDDGGKIKYEFTAGVSGERGNLLFVAEHSSLDELEDNKVTGFDNGVSWYSPVANTFYYSASQSTWANYWDSSLCGVIPNTVPQPGATSAGGRCGYAYSNVTWLYPQQDQNSVMTKYSYELTDDIQLNSRVSYVSTNTHSRYAPTPVSTNVVVMDPASPLAPASVASDSLSYIYIYHRSALLGNRDANLDKTAYDAVFGLEGFLDQGNGYDWRVNYQYTKESETLLNFNLINDIAFQNGLDNGDFDIFNVNGRSATDWAQHALDFYRSVAHTGIYKVDQSRNIVDGDFGGEIFSDGDMSLSFVVGGEFEQLDFTQQSDPESGQGFISGGSGGDDVFANRDRTAAYTEFAFDTGFGLELNAAARYDKYDMEGFVGDSGVANQQFSDTTAMFSAAYRPTDDMLFRVVRGQSFRAPTMSELFASRSFSFPSAYDYYYCEPTSAGGLGNPANDSTYCDATNPPQILTWYGGNPTLEPEHGNNLTAGMVWNVSDEFVFEISYYSYEYKDRIASISLSDILYQDLLSGGNSSSVTRGSDNQIDEIQAGSQNYKRTDTSGWDFGAAYTLDSEVGQFKFKFDASRVIDYINVSTDDNGNEIRQDIAGINDLPELNANLTVSWSKDDYYAAWRAHIIGKQEANSDSFNDIDQVIYHNLQFGMYLPWESEVTLGVRNVTDEEVPMYTDQVAWRNFNTTLYNPEGRTWFVSYQQRF